MNDKANERLADDIEALVLAAGQDHTIVDAQSLGRRLAHLHQDAGCGEKEISELLVKAAVNHGVAVTVE